MIKRVSSLYVGNVIDGDRLGYDGPLPADRRYSNERLNSVYGQALETARLCESLGFDTMWMAEHHYQREGYEVISNIPMLSLWLAQHTERIRFGCGFNVLPTWHPIRLAEDYATVDILTGGRLIFGVGRGYHERELIAMNEHALHLSDEQRRDYFEEQVEVLMKAFHEDSWSHHGEYFDLPPKGGTHRMMPLEDLTLVPRPANLPVETWQPTTSGNPRGVDFMAKHNIRGMIAGMPTPFAGKFAKLYQEANARQGRDLVLGEGLSVGFRTYIADTEKEARDRLRPIFEEYSKFAAPLGVFPYNAELLELMDRESLPVPEKPMMLSFEETLESGAWFAGTADQLVDRLKTLESELPGLEDILFNIHIPASHAENAEQLRRIGAEVMPAFSLDHSFTAS